MSSQLAVSAITSAIAETVQAGVSPHLPGATVTTLPPARAGEAQASHLNLFLYRLSTDAAFSNADWPPTRTRAGERGRPPLALSLHYLLTPYGQADQRLQPLDDMLLGYAMSTLHDHPVLDFAEILSAAAQRHVIQAGADLPWQTEGVRITFDPLSLDELTKLWTTFQGGFRTSVSYQVSVALLDSAEPTRASLPVLTRGLGDRGALVLPQVALFPLLETIWVQLPGVAGTASHGEALITSNTSYSITGPAAVPGSTIIVRGQNLDVVAGVVLVAVRTGIGPPSGFGGGTVAASLIPQIKSPTEIVLTVPTDVPAAGRYLLTARAEVSSTERPGGVMHTLSNGLPIMIGTRSVFDATTVALTAGAAIGITTLPPVIAGQDPSLILGSQVLTPESFLAPSSHLSFRVDGLTPGLYQARVRIDGIDSPIQPVTLR